MYKTELWTIGASRRWRDDNHAVTMIRLAAARIVQYPTNSDLVFVNNKIGISPKLVFKKTKVAVRQPRGG